LRPTWAKLARPYLKKQNKNKWTEVMAQIINCLPRKCMALGSIPSTKERETDRETGREEGRREGDFPKMGSTSVQTMELVG
jgi:hypothetical protein